MALAAGAAALVFLSGPAAAVPITYVFEGTVSGTLDSVPFTDAAFTFTVEGDTENVVQLVAWNNSAVAPPAFELEGFGTAMVTDDVNVISGSGGSLALVGWHGLPDSSDDPSNMLATFGPASELANYELDTALGPVVAGIFSPGDPGTMETDLGILDVTSFTGTVTFQAIVPEPSVLLLVLAGLGAALARGTGRMA